MLVVTVTFDLKPGSSTRFLPLMLNNARASRELEPGCRQFDVCLDPKNPNKVFLYEVYDNDAAFDEHLAAEHFRRFDAEVSTMLESKEVRRFRLAT